MPYKKSRTSGENEPPVNLAKVIGYTVDGEESGEWAEEIKKFYFSYNSFSESEMKEKVKYGFFYNIPHACHIKLICKQVS